MVEHSCRPCHGSEGVAVGEQVQDMRYMFAEAINFNGDLSGWDTSNVITVLEMFAGGGWVDGTSRVAIPAM